MAVAQRILASVTFALILAGCAGAPPQLPMPLSKDALLNKGGRVGVAMKALPAVDTSFPGASCLLCMAAASVANTQLTAYTKTLPREDLPKLKQDVADLLKKSGADVVVIVEDIDPSKLPSMSTRVPNAAAENFAAMKDRYKIDRLVMIEVNQLGFERTYQAYFPSSDPKAVFRGRVYLVNLSTNAYEWYVPIAILKSSDSAWDEAPKFPGLSNAYFQAVELGRDAVVKPLEN